MCKSFKYILAAVVALLFSTAAFAAGDGEPDYTKIKTGKTVEARADGSYVLTLDTFVEGYQKITSDDEPVDFVLVLDVSGSMKYSIDGTQKTGNERINALKSAVNAFADIIEERDPAHVLHQVSLVTFSSSAEVNTGLTSSMNTIKTAVNKLTADGGTMIDQGLSKASSVFIGSDRAETAKRVCIVFTDGGPGNSGWSAWDNNNSETSTTGTRYVAKNAVKIANDLKTLDNPVTIYSIGIFSDDSDVSDEFMERISSDFSDADTFIINRSGHIAGSSWGWYSLDSDLPWDGTLYDGSGNKANAITKTWTRSDFEGGKTYYVKYNRNYYEVDFNGDSGDFTSYGNGSLVNPKHDFYSKETSKDGLVTVFASIADSETNGGAGVSLNKDEVVLKDIVTSHFVVPDASSITTKIFDVKSVTGTTGNWVYEFENTPSATNPSDVNVSKSIKDGQTTIDVTGFDFTANWVGLTQTEINGKIDTKYDRYHGKKLTIEITIAPNPDDVGGVVTTNAPESGVYVDGVSISKNPGGAVANYDVPEAVYTPMDLKITKDGLISGDSAIFTITRSLDGELDKDFSYTVVLTADENNGTEDAVIAKVDVAKDGIPYIYSVTETSWSWTYSSTESPESHALYDGNERTNVFSFTNSAKKTDIKHAEKAERNTFK